MSVTKKTKKAGKMGGWQNYDGSVQPVADDVVVGVRRRNRVALGLLSRPARRWDWDWSGDGDILQYRIVLEDAPTSPEEVFSAPVIPEEVFSPMAARNRIREIKISMRQLEAEQRSLVSALAAEGFILIAKGVADAIAAAVAISADPVVADATVAADAFVWNGTFHVGDTVEALKDYGHHVTKGGAYRVGSVYANLSEIVIAGDNEGKAACLPMYVFKVVSRSK